jgi:hypothetical protein
VLAVLLRQTQQATSNKQQRAARKPKPRGAFEKEMSEVTYICRSRSAPKKSNYFILLSFSFSFVLAF